ncbi:hypothetical protein FHT28_003550 [Rhizobium sp. SG570]|nr:hypothetical protein [Rhizobium sp. SG570]
MRLPKSRESLEFFFVLGLYGLSIVSALACATVDIGSYHTNADAYSAQVAALRHDMIDYRK